MVHIFEWNSKYYSTKPTAKNISAKGIANTVSLFGARGVGVLDDRHASRMKQ